ncbi:hypothetical protein [Saccharopolyspora spinosa]|uniref:hypothetical protein n=1 Tax=Saccharopolyspora spinosa TaxID=60894 RepID=UPI000237B3FA|nr:hypothetical protein [Saccharopolyspora spinosa]
MSVLIAVLAPCLLLVFAVLVDGADRLRVLARADAIAAETARAALTALDTRGPAITLDPVHAATAARRYLTATHHTGTLVLDGARTVHVTVWHSEPAAIGLLWTTHTVTGSATAQLAVGTNTPGSTP